MSTQSEESAPTIYTLLKLVEHEAYAREIVEGSLRLNTVRYFKEYRDAAGELRGDRYEGVTGVLQPSRLSELRIGNNRIPAAHIVSPLLIHRPEHLDWRVFCLYALGSNAVEGNTEFDSWDDLKRALQPDQRCSALGSFVVFFTNANEFLKRVAAALDKLKVRYRFGLVEYYDEETFHGTFGEDDVPFRKRLRYKSQREYRVAYEPDEVGPDPFILQIGSLADIAKTMPLEEFCSKLRFGLRDLESGAPEELAR